MLTTALFFAAALVLVTSTSSTCLNSISCPCGISNISYTFCIDDTTIRENPCARWSQCETCQEGYDYCITCPSGHSGRLCTRDRKINRRKRYYYGNSVYSDDDMGIYCVQQDNLRHGKAMVHTIRGTRLQDMDDLLYPVGTKLEYSCDHGYSLVGRNILECEPSGFWSGESPNCTAKTTCVAKDPIFNGVIIVHTIRGATINDPGDSRYPVGTVLEYLCHFGYQLRGSKKLRCEQSGFWSSIPPACVKACGKSLIEPNHKITNGNRTHAGEWPWMVAISLRLANGYTRIICGGALLDKRTVLSAAHCFGFPPSYYVLHFGKWFRRNIPERGLEVRNIARIFRHEQYNPVTFENDIAILKLESSVIYTDRIQPICLPTSRSTKKNLVAGNKGYLTGYGVTELQLMADELLMARLKVQSDRICNLSYRRNNSSFFRRSGMFCAGYKEGIISACRADSGSPFVFYNRSSHSYTLEGCVSFNTRGQCDQPGKYTVFTRIASYIPWIEKNRRRRN